MLVTIRKPIPFRSLALALLLCSAAALVSCATKDSGVLINDPTAKRETALPWNEQTDWEREGEGAALNQQHR
jgi:hypothetical protein